MIKIHVKDKWDNIKHHETAFIEEMVDAVGKTVNYDDDEVEFDISITNIEIKRSEPKEDA